MFRKSLKEKTLFKDDSFKFRGTDNTRIEALSDGVFAIATALLVISSSMPETYAELILFLKDLIPFAICITMLMLIWYQHYIFFIRYGFKDAKIVAINTLLLFLILFYVYPLKFLFKLLFQMFTAISSRDQKTIDYLFNTIMPTSEAPTLMSIYGFGAAAIFFTLAWMYFIAWKRREQIELTEVEVFDTKTSFFTNILMGTVPIISMLISLLVPNPNLAFSLAGISYWLYPPVMFTFGYFNRNKKRELLKKLKISE